MDIPGPQNARGRILYDARQGRREAHRGDDPRHQRLPRPADPAGRGVGHARADASRIGGAAFLKAWFDKYEAESALSTHDGKPNVIEMAAGDSVGATPPISAFFEDMPTIDVMNMMGIDIDGLGNHNFDRSADFLRTTSSTAHRRRDQGELPVRLGEHRRRQRQDAEGVVAVAHVQVRARHEDRHRRLLERRHPVADEAGRARSVPRRELARRGQRRGGEDREEGGRRRGDRPPRRDRRDARRARPGRSSISPTACRTSTP